MAQILIKIILSNSLIFLSVGCVEMHDDQFIIETNAEGKEISELHDVEPTQWGGSTRQGRAFQE